MSPATLLKKDMAQVLSCQYCEIINNILFNRTPPVAASDWYLPHWLKMLQGFQSITKPSVSLDF